MPKERRWAKAGHGLVGLPLGSSRGTLIVAGVLVALFVAVIVVVSTSGPLRHTSFPGHPYPPSGLVQNPFSSNPDDLLNVTDVARVKAEFSRDGDIDLQAVERGDTAILAQARTGNALDSLRKLIDTNNSQGIAEHELVKDNAVIVGRLPDPGGPAQVTWCVEERGVGTIAYFVKSTGAVVRTQAVPFDYRIWLAQVGDRFLITDVGAV
jgi:hypothetical protein